MKKIILILIAVAFLLSLNAVFADDMNSTDVVASSDNDTAPVDTLKAPVADSTPLLKASNSKKTKAIDKSKTIKAKDFTKYFMGPKDYTAKLYKKNGKPLKNTKVKISVNKRTYTIKTDKKGKALLKINLKAGSYKITIKNPKTGFKLTTKVKVLPTIKSKDMTKVYKTNNKFRVKFLNGKGKPLAKKKVSYWFNGTKHTNKTNKKGYIVFSTKDFKKGKYKFRFYHPDGSKRTNVVKVVTSAKTKIIAHKYNLLKSRARFVKVRLIDKYGCKVTNKTVIAKIGGKTFKAKTNSKGIAKIKIKYNKKGIYKIRYIFKKNGYYKSSKTTSKVYIYPYRNPTFTVKSTKTFGYKAHTLFKLRLSSGNIPLIKKTITFKVKGKTFKRTTNANGMISFPVDLAVGKHILKCSIKKDSVFNSKTSKIKITVKKRTKSYFTWVGNTTFYQGLHKCQIQMKDSHNKVMAGKKISMTVKSKKYTATTSSKGVATFDVIIPPGNYKVFFRYDGDNNYDVSKKTVKINATHKTVAGYGYWLKKEQFDSVSFENLTSLAQQGVTDIFLSSDTIAEYGKDRVESWIENASSLSIKVHLWVTVFKNTNNNVWTSAIEDGAINTAFYTQKINEIKQFSKIRGVVGIHLDYLRVKTAYKTEGATDAINQFVKQATGAIRDVNKELIISCAVAAKFDDSIYYHAQNFTFISQYMDLVMPMVYKGNLGKTTSWITTATKWYIQHSLGAKIWVGLQTYKSDSDITILSMDEMNGDVQAAVNGGAAGLVLFRWGLTNYVNFNDYALV